MDPIKISEKLISFKSITPKSSGSIEYITKMLEKNKFECTHLEFGDQKVKNLFAIYRGGKGPTICFAGHTDVVPPGDLSSWKSNPFKPIIKNGAIFGRGSSDMKTAIASFISASFDFISINRKFNGSVCLLITADEEGEAKFGTKKVVEWLMEKKKKINFCIVGEPTNPNKIGEMIKIGRRGSLNGKIIVFGKQGHVAYPELATNPNDELLKVCRVLTKPLNGSTKFFQPSKIIITSIDVKNDVPNLIPSKAQIKFNVRFNDELNSKKVINLINSRLKKTKVKFNMTTSVSGESFRNYSGKFTRKLVGSIKKISRLTPVLSTSGGTSDARFISKVCPVLEFGSVGKTMHQSNENVFLKDIILLKEIYLEFLKQVFVIDT
tara:strand:- start:1712 stop:2848 length:1137 start_codon:yes stop_codon:yes gene_type:complete